MVIDVLERGDLLFPRSLPEFQRMFPNEAACVAYLERARWGDGFVCDHCDSPGEPSKVGNVAPFSATQAPALGQFLSAVTGGNREA